MRSYADSTSPRPIQRDPEGAFPQVSGLIAAESGTSALVGATLGPDTMGEQRLAGDLLSAFDPGMLVLADRTMARDVLDTGAHPRGGPRRRSS